MYKRARKIGMQRMVFRQEEETREEDAEGKESSCECFPQ